MACEVSTDAVVAGAAGGGAEPGADAPAAEVSEAAGCAGWTSLGVVVSVLVTAEASGAFALVLLIRGT